MRATTKLLQSIPVDELTGAIAVPIYQTSTFVQEAPGVNKGFDYSRSGNPTRQALETIVAELEGGQVGVAFSSGLAAIDAVLRLLSSGDEIIAVDDIYGGAFRLFEKVYRKFGVSVRYVDTTDLAAGLQRHHTPDAFDLARDPDQSYFKNLRHCRDRAPRAAAKRVSLRG